MVIFALPFEDSDEELKLALALSADEAKKPTEFEQGTYDVCSFMLIKKA